MAAATVMAFSQIQAGRQAQRVARYNAQLYEMDAVNAENEAIVVQQKAELEKSRFRDQFEGVQGDVRVGFAGGGVDLSSGTVLEILEQNKEQADIDENLIQYNANIKKANLQNQAGRSRFQGAAAIQRGKYAKYGSRLGAASTLLGAASNAGMIG